MENFEENSSSSEVMQLTPGSNPGSIDPIVVVGIACRLPGCVSSVPSVWDFLLQGKSGQCDVPKLRFNIDAFYHENPDRPGTTNAKGGYFLSEDVRDFENSFFGIGNVEAANIDPQQRKLIEVVYECFENSGTTLHSVAGRDVGCYVGNFTADNIITQLKDPDYLSRYTALGVSTSILANRISHVFDLCGPSVVVDTACSSSLYSLDAACTALRNGQCSSALVLGANLILSPEQHLATGKAGVLSPTSTSHTFDKSADGYGRGEGIGALYLKPLSTALRDRDHIRAVIVATAVNANGNTPGIMHPIVSGQEAVIRKAYQNAGIDFDSTAYQECHGTGTAVGDPVEIKTLSKVFSSGRSSKNPLLVGAVKPNFGHSEATSGITGMIKVILALEHSLIPPTIGVNSLNPEIKFDDWHLRLVTEPTPWPETCDGVKRAAVNSFGFGGANGHAILEAVDSYLTNHTDQTRPEATSNVQSSTRLFFLPVSAESTLSLKAWISEVAPSVAKWKLPSLAYTLGSRRRHMSMRSFLITSAETIKTDWAEAHFQYSTQMKPKPLAFVFTGQGAQWAQMGRSLMTTFPKFATFIKALDRVLQSSAQPPKWSLEGLFESTGDWTQEAEKAQPACTALQLGLVQLLQHWGIEPEAVVGHSSGEIPAAHCTGLLTTSQAILVSYYRGLAVKEAQGEGTMLAVGMEEQAANELIGKLGLSSLVAVACVNSPQNVTLSGDSTGISRLQSLMEEANIFCRRLQTGGRAYHSPQMKPVGSKYQEMLDTVFNCACPSTDIDPYVMFRSVPRMISTVNGKPIDTNLGAQYWRKNLESPVLFSRAIKELEATSAYHLIELGPHSALELPLKQIRAASQSSEEAQYTSALYRFQDQERCLLNMVGHLYLLGHVPSFSSINVGHNEASLIADLPPYKWNYESRAYYESRVSVEYKNRRYIRHELLGSEIPGGDAVHYVWKNYLATKDVRWVGDHKLSMNIVLPATAYIAMAIEAVSQIAQVPSSDKHNQTYKIRNMKISSLLTVPTNSPGLELYTNLKKRTFFSAGSILPSVWYKFVISSFEAGRGRQHCTGQVSMESSKKSLSVPSALPLTVEYSETLSTETWYRRFAEEGLNYGPAFRSIIEFNTTKTKQQAVASVPTLLHLYSPKDYIVHPIVIDACLQTALVASATGVQRDFQGKIPVFFEECSIFPQHPEYNTPARIKASVVDQLSRSCNVAISMFTANGTLLMELKNTKFTKYEGKALKATSQIHRDPCLRITWKPDPLRVLYPGSDTVVIENALKAPTLPHQHYQPQSRAFRRLLALLELLVHKDPRMRIIELGGHTKQSVAILERLCASSSSRSYRSYTTGQISEDGQISVIDVNHTSELKTQNEKFLMEARQFDLVILPDDFLASEYLAHHLRTLANHLAPNGYLLAAESSATVVPLSSHGLSSNFRFSSEGVSDLLFARKRKSSVENSGEVVVLVHDIRYTKQDDLFTELESLLSTNCCVRSYSIRDLTPTTIPKGSRIIALLELGSFFLSTMDDHKMTSVKYLTDNASTLLWLTSNQNDTNHSANPEKFIVAGLARAVMLEQPALKFLVYDIDSRYENRPQTAVNVFNTLFSDTDADTEYVQNSNGVIHVSRFVPAESLNKRFRLSLEHQLALCKLGQIPPSRLQIQTLGNIDSWFFSAVDPTESDVQDEGFVEVEVKVIGLNAKDVYQMAGKVETRLSTSSLECAGFVRKVGSNVTGIKVGDRVLVMAPGHFQTVERFPEWACALLQDEESFEEMASLSLVYVTAFYGLCHRGYLRKGETVLIHSGAGGVGLAAIEVAQLLGAVVYTTVSSSEKKEFLINHFKIPSDHIFSSLDISFADRLLSATNGAGVDVVLNSLQGDFLHESWRCCAPLGRFIEIGKQDILPSQAGALDMGVFGRSATFTAFDMAEIYHHAEERYHVLWASLLKEVVELYRLKRIRPITPLKTFDIAELPYAIRHFALRTRMGKVAISLENSQSLVKSLPPLYTTTFFPQKTYLLIGCLGGLGRVLTRWMVAQGAKRFVFLARSGAIKPSQQDLIKDLESIGISIEVVVGSVVNLQDVENAILACATPIGGVVQAAMGLHESLFTSMTTSDWQTALEPKVRGTWNLHNALLNHNRDTNLDFFLLMSSVSGSVGTATESNYCAANAFLDAFAKYRRSLGKPAVSVGLGMISEVGYLHEHSEIEALLLRKGIQPLNQAEFLSIVDLALSQSNNREERESEEAHVLTGLELHGITRLWEKGFDVTHQVLGDPRAAILANNLEQLETKFKTATSASAASGRNGEPRNILAAVKQRFSGLLLTPLEKIDLARPLVQYGIDSMIASEFRTWAWNVFGVDVPFIDMLSKEISLENIVERIKVGSRYRKE